MECSGRTQPSAPGSAERAPQRIDLGQGNAFTTSGTISADHLDRRPARLLDHGHVEVALLVGLDRGLVDRLEAGGAHEALDGSRRRADARSLLLLLHVGLPDRHALHRERKPARRDEGLGALVDEPGIDEPVGDQLAQVLGRARLHARGDFLGKQFEQKVGHGITGGGARR